MDAALAAGAPSVDVVGYSAGGVVAGLWVARDDGAAKARRVVTLGAPLAGTNLAATAAVVAPDACPAALPPARAGQRGDQRSWPGTGWARQCRGCRSGRRTTRRSPRRRTASQLAGTVQLQVQAVCPGARVPHSALPTDPAVTGLVLRALAPDTLAAGGDRSGLRATYAAQVDPAAGERETCVGVHGSAFVHVLVGLAAYKNAEVAYRDAGLAYAERSRISGASTRRRGPGPCRPSSSAGFAMGHRSSDRHPHADAVAEVVAQVLQVADPGVEPAPASRRASSCQSRRVGVRPSGSVASTAAISASGIPTRCPIRTSATRRSVSRR